MAAIPSPCEIETCLSGLDLPIFLAECCATTACFLYHICTLFTHCMKNFYIDAAGDFFHVYKTQVPVYTLKNLLFRVAQIENLWKAFIKIQKHLQQRHLLHFQPAHAIWDWIISEHKHCIEDNLSHLYRDIGCGMMG